MKLLTDLHELLADLARQMRERHGRHVSVGDLLTDRWELASRLGFGEGTSCYDNVLILGSVSVGRNCWIGPNVVLDGTGDLTIGDNVDISAGAQIYTHDTVGARAVRWRGADRQSADVHWFAGLHRAASGDPEGRDHWQRRDHRRHVLGHSRHPRWHSCVGNSGEAHRLRCVRRIGSQILLVDTAYRFRRHPGNDCPGRHVSGHHGTRSDESASSDGDPRQDRGV